MKQKSTLRRFLALVFSVVLCISLMSTIAMAQSLEETNTETPTIRLLTPVDVPDTPDEETPLSKVPEAAPLEDEKADEPSAADSDEAAPSEPAQNEADAETTKVPVEPSPDEENAAGQNGSDAEKDGSAKTDDGEKDAGEVEGDVPDQSDADSKEPDEGESKTDEADPGEPTTDAEEPPSEGDGETSDDADKAADPDETPNEAPEKPNVTPGESPETESVEYGDAGVTGDGIRWEFTCDSTTGQYTLTFQLDKTSEDGQPVISTETLAAIEEYAAEISRELAEKYGIKWEWNSASAPSEEDVRKFQVFLTSPNDHTYKYDSVDLEQMDGEFTLEKIDADTGRPITESETSFYLWHVNEVIDSETGAAMDVKMYCSYDAETNTYTFVPTEATIQTIGGKLEILYAMMKDTVYYLQEAVAPQGYEIDPRVHIVMEKDLWESKEDDFRESFNYLGEFTEDESGRIALDVKFSDIKTYDGNKGKITVTESATGNPTPPEPTPEPEPDFVEPTMTIPEEPIPVPTPTPLPEPGDYPIPDPTPEASVIPVPMPNTNDIPKTGDMMYVYMAISALSAAALVALMATGRGNKKDS